MLNITGTITKFPITTILEFATSADFGLCPTLCGEVRALDYASKNIPVSEAGIRLAVDQAKIDDIAFVNLGSGRPIYAFSDGISAYFYSVSGGPASYITGFLNDNTITLSANGDALSSFLPAGYSQPLSVQGGKHQYGNTFEVSSIPTTGLTLVSAVSDDCLAKMFIKCFTPVYNNGTTFNIGIDGDPERYVMQFAAPSSVGLFTNWRYGFGLTGEYDWLSADTDIILYMNGSAPVSGRLGVSMFYDHVEWPT